MFLLAGGMALIFLVYLVHLRPDLVDEYVLNTVGNSEADIPWSEFYCFGSRSVCRSSFLHCLWAGPHRLSAEVNDLYRRSERGREPRLIGYNLLSLWENPALNGKQTLKLLIRVHRLLNKAYLLKESFDQLWDYNRTGWARRLFENWRSAFRWQRLEPLLELFWPMHSGNS